MRQKHIIDAYGTTVSASYTSEFAEITLSEDDYRQTVQVDKKQLAKMIIELRKILQQMEQGI
jgi:hypothetical protein